MVPLTELWLPIVVSAVIVFIASAILHMVLPLHRKDYQKLPDEEGARAALRGVPRGLYMMPHCEHKEMDKPESKAKFKEGPVAVLTVMPSGEVNMGKFLGMWFVYCLVVSLFAAYVAGRALDPGTHYLQVFRIAGTAAFLAYGIGHVPNGIWGGQPWGVVTKHIVDGLIYALLTAGTFGWLWPRG